MTGRLPALALALVAALAGSTVATADGGGSQVIQGTVRVAGGLEVGLAVTPDSVPVGKDARATATVANGTGNPLVVILTLHTGDSGISVHGGKFRVVPSFFAGGTQTVTWRLCGREPGNYLVLVSARGIGRHGVFESAESSAELLRITPAKGRCQRWWWDEPD